MKLLLFTCTICLIIMGCTKFDHSEEKPELTCVECPIADSIDGTYSGIYREIIFTGNLGNVSQFDTIVDTVLNVTVSRYLENEPVTDSLSFQFTFSNLIEGVVFLWQFSYNFTEFAFLGGGFYDWKIEFAPANGQYAFNNNRFYSGGRVRLLTYEIYTDAGGLNHFYPRKEFDGYK